MDKCISAGNQNLRATSPKDRLCAVVDLVEQRHVQHTHWSNRCVVNVCGRWLDMVEFHEIGIKNRGDCCVMNESIMMGISSPFICHVLCLEVSCLWVLKVWSVDDEDCSEHVGFLF